MVIIICAHTQCNRRNKVIVIFNIEIIINIFDLLFSPVMAKYLYIIYEYLNMHKNTEKPVQIQN